MRVQELLRDMGVSMKEYQGSGLHVFSPIDGNEIAALKCDDTKTINNKIDKSFKAFWQWRDVPAPKRGELIRLLGDELRIHKDQLGKLVTCECGKIVEEGKGEVQEMIDICDFAVGLSRQLYGLTIASERLDHTMQENWLPLGVVGVITAFNFPVAVWAWNTALALVCGNAVVWKPSDKTPLTSLACAALFEKACKRFEKSTGEKVPENLMQIALGREEVGEKIVSDRRVALVSATGSTRMGRIVAPQVAKRFGRSLLELGGNNAVIVTPSADLEVALPSLVFGAVGTAGQRCTTTRRAIVHRSIYDEVCEKLEAAYTAIIEDKIGNPLDKGTLVGPLIDKASYDAMEKALENAAQEGGEIIGGKRVKGNTAPRAFYVEPALVKMKKQTAIVRQETFAPILYVMPYDSLEEAVTMQNDVPQGLSSAIFTTDVREAAFFKQYSDCGIANVNIGTSGAEIGGAFGGEKETGGGRESGSDAWKVYMRRQTSTTYHGVNPPALAQGIKFTV